MFQKWLPNQKLNHSPFAIRYWTTLLSEFGGSEVLTKAMAIVAKQGISFKDKNHSVAMYKPTTNPAQALQLVHQLELIATKKFVQSPSLRVSTSAMLYNMGRVRNKNDHYSMKDYRSDVARDAMSGVGIAGVALFIAGLTVTTGTVLAPIVGTAGTIASGIGAASLLWTKTKNLLEKP